MQLLINTVMLEKTRWESEKRADPDILQLIPMIAERTQFKGVEIWQYHISHKSLEEVEAVKAAGESVGLSFPVVGAYPLLNRSGSEREEQMKLLKHIMNCAAALGSEVVKIFAGGSSYADARESDWTAARSFLEEALTYAADRRLTVTVETHGNTLADCTPGVQRLLDLTEHTDLKVCFQPYKWEKLEPVLSDYDAVKDDIIHLHLQNRTEAGQSLLDEGILDFDAIIRHAKRAGFDGYLCVEFTKNIIQSGPFNVNLILDNAEQDRQFVEKVWQG